MTQVAIVSSGEFAPISSAPKPCWTCVRRRVKCDFGLPTCFKCRRHHRECLGYGSRPIVWTGVACRRKTKGKRLNGSCVNSTTTESPQSIDAGSLIPHFTAVVSANPTDPVFQDLNLGTRRNVEYYLRECCSECTIYGDDFGNPFKQILLLIPHNTVVRDIIVAISVYHQARASVAFPPAATPDLKSSLVKAELQPNSIDYATVMAHAYRATCSLRSALSSEDCSDAIVASSFLFTWLDMLDTEVPSWHHHLAGMKDLMCLRESKHASASTAKSVFHGFFREAYAMYVQHLPALLSRLPKEPSQNDVESILTRLENFSCSDWALHFPGKDLHKQRLHMASAYKGAIAIYASHALRAHCENPPLVGDMVDLALHHLKQISPSDSHFKGILWPAFILGAEARLPEQRLWVANALEQLYGMIHMWNIKRGLSVLQQLWTRPLPTYDRTSWLEEVYDMDEKLMLI
ncbi:fungal-specific transcription factor domain-containing protein [Diaporthe sp. PMI_573]|nr:fungal-specific transcription factor domain-containing protein [Diaporthaceae sp. PMI_573]